jgi:hypothetical protein
LFRCRHSVFDFFERFTLFCFFHFALVGHYLLLRFLLLNRLVPAFFCILLLHFFLALSFRLFLSFATCFIFRLVERTLSRLLFNNSRNHDGMVLMADQSVVEPGACVIQRWVACFRSFEKLTYWAIKSRLHWRLLGFFNLLFLVLLSDLMRDIWLLGYNKFLSLNLSDLFQLTCLLCSLLTFFDQSLITAAFRCLFVLDFFLLFLWSQSLSFQFLLLCKFHGLTVAFNFKCSQAL